MTTTPTVAVDVKRIEELIGEGKTDTEIGKLLGLPEHKSRHIRSRLKREEGRRIGRVPVKVQKLPLSLVLTQWQGECPTQLRAEIDGNTLAEYTELWKAGETFDRHPMVVFEIKKGKYLLADGYHRHKAALKAGIKEASFDIRKGTLDDAIEFAAACNGRHGLALNNKDKWLVVTSLRLLPRWQSASIHSVAKHTGFSKSFVFNVFNHMQSKSVLRERLASQSEPSVPTDSDSPFDAEVEDSPFVTANGDHRDNADIDGFDPIKGARFGHLDATEEMDAEALAERLAIAGEADTDYEPVSLARGARPRTAQEVQDEDLADYLRTLTLLPKLGPRATAFYLADVAKWKGYVDLIDIGIKRGAAKRLTGDHFLPFARALARFVRFPSPRQWLQCGAPGCQDGLVAEGNAHRECESCRGCGYVVPGHGGH